MGQPGIAIPAVIHENDKVYDFPWSCLFKSKCMRQHHPHAHSQIRGVRATHAVQLVGQAGREGQGRAIASQHH